MEFFRQNGKIFTAESEHHLIYQMANSMSFDEFISARASISKLSLDDFDTFIDIYNHYNNTVGNVDELKKICSTMGYVFFKPAFEILEYENAEASQYKFFVEVDDKDDTYISDIWYFLGGDASKTYNWKRYNEGSPLKKRFMANSESILRNKKFTLSKLDYFPV